MRKKKRMTAIFALVFLLQTFVCSASGVLYYYDGAFHEYQGNIFRLMVNGKILEPEMPPIVFSDYSVVPARSVFQDGLGATVEWDGSNRTVTVTMDGTELILTIDERIVLLNGEEVRMPIPPKIINDYTMIPARFVGETLGMTVDFDSSTDTVIINGKSNSVTVTDVSYSEESDTECLLTISTNTLHPKYDEFILKDPLRLVIDVTGGVYSKIPDVINVANGNVTQIRFGQQAESARIVVDLTKDLGYIAAWDGKDILVYITVDPKAGPTQGPSASSKPTATPKPVETDIFKLITYGYEGGRDYIKFGDVAFGTPTQKGNLLTIPVSGELPQKASETKVTGFFGQKMSYEPDDGGKSGTITVTLKSTEVEVYTEKGEVRLKSVHKALKRSVMLDAGHGGQDGGAVSYNEDGSIRAKEKDFNLDIALRAQKLLEAQGVEVHMIRTEDVYVDYLRVGSIANDAGTSLFVSIHTNSATIPQAHGIETYGYLEAGSVSNGMTGKRLSEILLNHLIEETEAYSRGVKDGKSLAVINSTKMPATLIEIGFISNEEECEKMMTEEYRQKLAQAVCDGVLEAFDEMGI